MRICFLSECQFMRLATAGITAESLAAAVELLQADYRGWHEPMPSEKREQILRAVFPDVSKLESPISDSIHRNTVAPSHRLHLTLLSDEEGANLQPI
jgi:hypothetical protein